MKNMVNWSKFYQTYEVDSATIEAQSQSAIIILFINYKQHSLPFSIFKEASVGKELNNHSELPHLIAWLASSGKVNSSREMLDSTEN